MRLRTLIILGGAGAAGLLLLRARARDVASYDLVAARPQEIRRIISATGRVEAREEVDVSPKVSGRIEALLVDEGDPVRKGQVIARLDSAELRARERQIQANLEDLRLRYRRAGDLLEDNLLAQAEYDAAKAAYEAERANLDYVRAQLANTVITSPLDGVVVKKFLDEGESVNMMMANPAIVTVADMRQLKVVAEVDETDVGRLALGQHAYAEFDAYPGRKFSGGVSKIGLKLGRKELFSQDPTRLQTDTKVLETEIVLEEPGGLAIGLTAEVTIEIVHKEAAVAVPGDAVRREGNRAYLLVAEGGRARAREVRLGESDDLYVEVVGGLAEGEYVVVDRNGKVREGDILKLRREG